MMTDKKLIIMEDGTEAFEYADGTVRNAKGHWLRQPPAAFGTAPKITSENASGLAARRHELAKEAAAAGMRNSLDAATDYEAWGTIVGKQAHLATQVGREKGVSATVQAAKFVGSAAGLLEEKKNIQATQVNITIDKDILESCEQILGDEAPQEQGA